MGQSSISILDHVPWVMRKVESKVDDNLPAILAPLLAQAGADPDTAFGYILGALDYRDRICNPDKESKVLKATLRRVEEVERRSSGRLLGTKVKLTFESMSSGELKSEEMFTEWIEYHGSPELEPHAPFYLALSRTVYALAQKSIGREVFIRKAFFNDVKGLPNNAKKVRFVANLEVHNNSEDSSEDRSPQRSEGRLSRSQERRPAPSSSSRREDSVPRPRQEIRSSDIVRMADDEGLSDFSGMNRRLLGDVAELLNRTSKTDDLIDGIAEILDVPASRVDGVWPDGVEPLVAATRVLDRLY